MAERIDAPWTMSQVRAVNRFQFSGEMHPFTCPDRNDGDHRTRIDEPDHGILMADERGRFMYCRDCSYRQRWVWDFMAVDPSRL